MTETSEDENTPKKKKEVYLQDHDLLFDVMAGFQIKTPNVNMDRLFFTQISR